jgi:hypothetical protein
MIDIEKIKAAKGDAIATLQAVKVEAQAMRLADGGAAMVTIDALIVQLDVAIAHLAQPK